MVEETKEKESQKDSKNNKGGRPQKETEFLLFVEWYAKPQFEREEMGIKHMQDFAAKYKLDPTTLTRWRKSERFDALVNDKRSHWLKEKTPNVLAALYKRILKYGISSDVELWLSFVEKWDRKQIIENKLPRLDPDDVRSLILLLPDNEQKQFYEQFAVLLAKAKQHASDSTDGGDSPDEQPGDDSDSVSGQADNTSADDSAGDQVAKGTA